VSEQPSERGKIQLPLAWIGVDELPIILVNQFLGQFLEDEFILTFGTVAPPPLLGDPEQRLEQAKQIEFLPVQAVTRFGLTRTRLEELVRVLKETLDNYDEHQESEKS
jgi:hypothetical protein